MNDELILDDAGDAERISQEDESLNIGQWYRVDGDDIMCVSHVGSNYAKVTSPDVAHEIHFDEWDKRCKLIEDVGPIIDERVSHYQSETRKLLKEIGGITARLGVTPKERLGSGSSESSMALETLSANSSSVDDYKTDLIKAKDEDLPNLFQKVKDSNEMMALWMKMETIPYQAYSDSLNGVIGKIEGRISNVSLYAGLTEDIVHIREGDTATLDSQLHIMQSRCYMDEESLANYETGGMEYENIGDFDKWISRDDNFNRLLPFDRCVVSFKVRRFTKDRSQYGFDSNPIVDSIIKNHLAEMDKLTFLYIRNGDNLYRMDTEIDFSDKFFPKDVEFANDKTYVSGRWNDYDLISDNDYETRILNYINTRESFKNWIQSVVTDEMIVELESSNHHKRKKSESVAFAYKKALSSIKRNRFDNFYKDSYVNAWSLNFDGRGCLFDCFQKSYTGDFSTEDPREKYYLYNSSTVEYDRIGAEIDERIKKYNRMSLIIQGLFDRSEVFHPHPPVQLWNPDSFATNIKLVYDADYVLNSADEPDWDEYKKKGCEDIGVGSIVIGQQNLWLRDCANKERNKNRRWRDSEVGTHYSPDGNPGPGFIARVDKMTKTGKCTFKWIKMGVNWRGDYDTSTYGKPMKSSFTTHRSNLFNVSNYNVGDFKIFFDDCRWRLKYLKWSPYLLSAEEYYAGNLKVGSAEGRYQSEMDKQGDYSLRSWESELREVLDSL